MDIESFISDKAVYRTLGRDSALGFLGCGFMRKAGTREDIVNFGKNEYSMVYVLRGRGEYIDGENRRHALMPGTIFHRLPRDNHSTILDPTSDWAECFIALGSEMFSVLEVLGILGTRTPVFSLGLSLETVKRFDSVLLMLGQASERELGSSFLSLVTLLHDITRKNGVRSKEDLLVEMACERLENDLENRVPLQSVARDLSIGYERFRKLFKNTLGISPNEYRIRRRMERARVLLLQENSIKSVAAELGYPNTSSFAVQFKQEVGVAPGKFRSQ